ncbi:MAG: hypothetical protein HYU78_02195 [Rhodocyclales bacterium]|nr:hypothetical protein [Rhodocyclales bacterium]
MLDHLDHLFRIVILLACLVILYRAEPAVSRMSPATPLLIRIAFNLLCCAALGGVFYALAGAVPAWLTALLALAVAVLILCERRVQILSGTRAPRFPQPPGNHL